MFFKAFYKKSIKFNKLNRKLNEVGRFTGKIFKDAIRNNAFFKKRNNFFSIKTEFIDFFSNSIFNVFSIHRFFEISNL